jgi:peptidoglycan/xylan/chitin deacetylase (PgdA/CDA1 family)
MAPWRAVSHPNRRRFLGALSAAVLAGVGIEQGVFRDPPHTLTAAAAAAPPPHPASGTPFRAAVSSQPAPIERVPLPGGGVLNKLPGDGNLLALTLDDGVNTDVVRLYTQFARDTGIRLTYFVNGMYRSWTDNLALLRPLVESGQIQLGNHTWSHPNLAKMPVSRVAKEISRNDEFLKSTFGVDARPYLGPRTEGTTRPLMRWPPISATRR